MVCEKWYVKDDVRDGVWKMVCETLCEEGVWKRVCGRLCVTKLRVRTMVCDKVVGKMKDGVWKIVCQRGCVKEGVWWKIVLCDEAAEAGGGRLEEESPGYRIKNKNPTQRCGGNCGWQRCVWEIDKDGWQRWWVKDLVCKRARHQSQPSAISATPATWNEGTCRQVPRLPRNGGWQRCVCVREIDKDGWQRWWVKDGVCKRWCVKDGMWKMMWEMVCERWCDWCVWKIVCQRGCVKEGVWWNIVLWHEAAEAGGGRWEAGGGEPGIQNQKQEPHTKMWGIRRSRITIILAQLCNPTVKGSSKVPGLFRLFGACIFASPLPGRDWNPTDSLLGNSNSKQ